MSESPELAEDLERILSGNSSVRFCFQPIADLQRGSVAGYEVLARLPTRSNLPPDRCLHAAARLGIGPALEEILARQALRTRSQLPPNTFLCVNISPGFLLSDAWSRLLGDQPSLSGIVMEITEEDVIADYDRIRACVAEIRSRGGSIAIDDTGAGYASLKHILELRPNFVKLDRTLVHRCDTDRAKAVVIEMIGNAVGRMDAWVVAEGVETEGELTELLRLGVPLAQGYFCGRPEWELQEVSRPAARCMQKVRINRQEGSELLLHADSCPTVTSVAAGEQLLARQPDQNSVAVIDEWNRPVALLERRPGGEVIARTDIMRCQKTSGLREALQRALTRPVALRFDPIALIDRTGKLVAIARVDRLMCASIASSAGGIDPHGRN